MENPPRIVEANRALDAIDAIGERLAANECPVCVGIGGPVHLKAIGGFRLACPVCGFQRLML
jgi:hypothetical protein